MCFKKVDQLDFNLNEFVIEMEELTKIVISDNNQKELLR